MAENETSAMVCAAVAISIIAGLTLLFTAEYVKPLLKAIERR